MKPSVAVTAAAAYAQTVAQRIIDTIHQSIADHHRCTIALAGGSTPQPIYQTLASHTYQEQVNWNKVYFFLSDERIVDPQSQDANIFHIRQNLLDHIPIPENNVLLPQYQVPDLEKVANEYQASLMRHFQTPVPSFDLILLGIGTDGHTASIFPNTQETAEPSNDFIIPVADSPKPPPHRISFSFRLINAAKKVYILATGKEKSTTVKTILNLTNSQPNWPTSYIKTQKTTWMIDDLAVKQLKHQH